MDTSIYLYLIDDSISWCCILSLSYPRHKKSGWKSKKSKTLSFYEQAKHDLTEIATKKQMYKEQRIIIQMLQRVKDIHLSEININALEMTSHEMLDSLKETCDALKIDDLRAILTTVDFG